MKTLAENAWCLNSAYWSSPRRNPLIRFFPLLISRTIQLKLPNYSKRKWQWALAPMSPTSALWTWEENRSWSQMMLISLTSWFSEVSLVIIHPKIEARNWDQISQTWGNSAISRWLLTLLYWWAERSSRRPSLSNRLNSWSTLPSQVTTMSSAISTWPCLSQPWPLRLLRASPLSNCVRRKCSARMFLNSKSSAKQVPHWMGNLVKKGKKVSQRKKS